MINPEDFKDKFGLWYSRFLPFIQSEKCEILYSKLKARVELGAKIFPKSANTFRAFSLTNPSNINCIIIGQSPYHTVSPLSIPHADGLAFGSKFSKTLTPSLEKWYDALDKDLDMKCTRTTNLDYLAEQGVLLLNASFTTEMGKPSIHEDLGIWDDFNNFLYKEVLKGFCAIPIICMGQSAKRLSNLLFPLCHVYKIIEHPAKAAREGRSWDNDDCFNWANKILKENNGPFKGIQWDEDYYNSIPF